MKNPRTTPTRTTPAATNRTTTRRHRARAVLAGGIIIAIGASAVPAMAGPPTDPFPFTTGMKAEKVPVRKSAPNGGIEAASASAALPASVDLTPWAVPSGNQGPVGSCTAWAVAYTAAGWYANKLGTAGTPFAPMSVYSIHTNGNNSPTEISAMIDQTTKTGIDMLSDYPQGNFDYKTLPTPAQRQMAANFKFTGSVDIFRNAFTKEDTAVALRTQLAAGKPVIIGMIVYTNFGDMNATNNKYTSISGSIRGGHAVVALGYDEFGILIQNSWGTKWGKDGFAWLSWDMVNRLVTRGLTVTGATFAAKDTPAPDITSFDTTSAPFSGGTKITVKGTNLKGGRFSFGGVLEPMPTFNADGSEATITLAGMTAVGKTLVLVETVTGKDTDDFTFTGPAPVISSVYPSTGSAAGGTKVKITGTGLHAWSDGKTKVTVGNTVVPFTKSLVNGTSLEIVMPPSVDGFPGKTDITVTTSQGTVTKVGSFTYGWASSPKLAITAPKVVGVGDVKLNASLTRNGNVPIGGAAVTFQSRVVGGSQVWAEAGTAVTNASGGAELTVKANSSTEYRFAAAGGVVSAPVLVQVKPIAKLSALSATTGPKAGGNTITVSGTDMAGQTVYFGSVAARVISTSVTGAVVAVPKSSVAGTVAVTAKNQAGVSNSVSYTYA